MCISARNPQTGPDQTFDSLTPNSHIILVSNFILPAFHLDGCLIEGMGPVGLESHLSEKSCAFDSRTSAGTLTSLAAVFLNPGRLLRKTSIQSFAVGMPLLLLWQ